MQTTLIAYIKDEEAIEAIDGFVFRDHQPTDVALELLKSLGRKHRREKRSVVLDNGWNFNQREHISTSRNLNRRVFGDILPFWGYQRRSKAIRSLQKSSNQLTCSFCLAHKPCYQALPDSIQGASVQLLDNDGTQIHAWNRREEQVIDISRRSTLYGLNVYIGVKENLPTSWR